VTNQGFTGHRHNNTGTNDLGLIYMNARYYLPEVGRFISPDTIVPDPNNPQSHNRYAYVLNSPVNYTDPSGHRECEIICDGETVDWKTYQDAAWTGEWDPEQQAANAAAAETVLTGVTETAAGILWEPADWALALRDGFQWYDSLGMLPFVPATVGRYGDDISGVILRHADLKKITKGSGYEAHHIIEKRFAETIGMKEGDMLSVALTKQQHQEFTNAWRDFIGYVNSNNPLTTTTAQVHDIWRSAQSVYEEFPLLLDAAYRTLFHGKGG
jgi:RHS repeat-associated protein